MDNRLAEGIGIQVTAMGCELVDMRLLRSGRQITLQIFIDKDGGVDIDDCAAVSRQLSVWLDVENPIHGAYRLEVSSPGLDRPLTKAADYQRFLGDEAEIELHALLDGRRRWRGTLLAADESSVRLATETGEQSFLYSAIHRAKLVPKW